MIGLRGAYPSLFARNVAPGARLQMAVTLLDDSRDRRRAVRAAGAVARAALDYVHDEREALERALDVVAWWVDEQAGAAGIAAARDHAAEVASRADAADDRCAWLAMKVAVTLADLALEPMPDLAGKGARDLVAYALEAMCWPDVDDPQLRAAAAEALHARIDEALDAVPVGARAKPRFRA